MALEENKAYTFHDEILISVSSIDETEICLINKDAYLCCWTKLALVENLKVIEEYSIHVANWNEVGDSLVYRIVDMIIFFFSSIDLSNLILGQYTCQILRLT
jgi:hypothetical protein